MRKMVTRTYVRAREAQRAARPGCTLRIRPHRDNDRRGVGLPSVNGSSRARRVRARRKWWAFAATARPGELRLVAAAFRGFRYGDVGQSEGVLNPAPLK